MLQSVPMVTKPTCPPDAEHSEAEHSDAEHSDAQQPEPKSFETLYAELAALPENRVGEIIGGDLYSFPRPASPHAKASTRLGAMLGPYFDDAHQGADGPSSRQPGGWAILDEPELHIGGDVLVPDIAGWRRERMPVVPEVAFFTLAPDWVCEVQSPSTTAHDRKRKLPRYAAMGVQHVWFVDPRCKTIEVFKLETATATNDAEQGSPRTDASTAIAIESRTALSPHYVLSAAYSDDEVAAIPPFEALELDVGVLWRM